MSAKFPGGGGAGPFLARSLIGFLASGLSTYHFSTLFTTLPHNLIKQKLTELIEQLFNRDGSLYLACNDKNAFFYFRTT